MTENTHRMARRRDTKYREEHYTYGETLLARPNCTEFKIECLKFPTVARERPRRAGCCPHGLLTRLLKNYLHNIQKMSLQVNALLMVANDVEKCYLL